MLNIRYILSELKKHISFTIFGAVIGIIAAVFLVKYADKSIYYNLFYILHPLHVVLSALVTSSIYKYNSPDCNEKRCNFWILLIIGYLGSIGIATLSDSIIPFLGEYLLNLPNREVHLGFIEKWWLINPMAVLGIVIAYYWPATKFPHSGHVLLSTWASLFHILMSIGDKINFITYLVIFIFLFFAVWIPCCVSDIVFPLFIVNEGRKYHKKHKEVH